MPALTTFIAVAGIAAAIGGTVAQKQAAAKQRSAAKKQANQAKAAAQAKPPSADTGANIALRRNDQERRRGKGSLAARRRATATGLGASLQAPSASAVGGLYSCCTTPFTTALMPSSGKP